MKRLGAAIFLSILVCNCPSVGAETIPRSLTLPNGIHIVLSPEPESELVSIVVVVRTGTDTDPVQSAAGRLVARSLLYGSVNRSYESVREAVLQVGCQLFPFSERLGSRYEQVVPFAGGEPRQHLPQVGLRKFGGCNQASENLVSRLSITQAGISGAEK